MDIPITDWIQALAVVVGVEIARRGLSTWRLQLGWQTKHDAALGLVKAAMRLRDALQTARRTCTTGEIGVRGQVDDIRAAARVVDESIVRRMRRLDDAKVVAEAVFGDEVPPLLEPVWEVVGQVRAAVKNEILSRAEGAAPRPRSERSDRLGTWTSDDPERDAGTKVVHDCARPVAAWSKKVLELA